MADSSKTGVYENLAVKNNLPSSLEVQAASLNSMIFVPGSTMTRKEQADAYSSLATRYGNELNELKRELKANEVAVWQERMDSE